MPDDIADCADDQLNIAGQTHDNRTTTRPPMYPTYTSTLSGPIGPPITVPFSTGTPAAFSTSPRYGNSSRTSNYMPTYPAPPPSQTQGTHTSGSTYTLIFLPPTPTPSTQQSTSASIFLYLTTVTYTTTERYTVYPVTTTALVSTTLYFCSGGCTGTGPMVTPLPSSSSVLPSSSTYTPIFLPPPPTPSTQQSTSTEISLYLTTRIYTITSGTMAYPVTTTALVSTTLYFCSGGCTGTDPVATPLPVTTPLERQKLRQVTETILSTGYTTYTSAMTTPCTQTASITSCPSVATYIEHVTFTGYSCEGGCTGVVSPTTSSLSCGSGIKTRMRVLRRAEM